MILSSVSVAAEWHTIVPGATEGQSALFEAVDHQLAEVDAPEITWSVERVSASVIASVLGRGHEYLIVRFRGFPEHFVLIGCESFGATLAVGLLVVAQARFGRSLRRAVLFRSDLAAREEVGSELGIGAATRLSTLIGIVRFSLDDALKTLFGSDATRRRPVTHPSQLGDLGNDE